MGNTRIAVWSFCCALTLAMTLAVSSTYGVEMTWNGGAGNWGESTKWTPNGVPGEGDTAVIDAGGSMVTVAVGRAASSVQMGAGTQLWIAGGATLDVADTVDAAALGAFVVFSGNNAQLSTGDGPGSIGGLVTDIVGTGTTTLNTGGDVAVGAFADEGYAPDGLRTLVKQGVGTLSFDSTVPGSVFSAEFTTFRIEEGTLSSAGDDPLGGSTKVELAGVGPG